MGKMYRKQQKNNFSIVGIGASAGGLQASTQLLEHIPSGIGMAFVLMQHLDPKQKSLLPELLSRVTHIPVIEAANGVKIAINHVYVIPPGVEAIIVNNALKLTPCKKYTRLKPIDIFFTSLAHNQKEKAIGIVLSGTGKDGTKGLQAIKSHGGITFAQDETAQSSDMPQSAIAKGAVDFVLPPWEIAQALVQISDDGDAIKAAGGKVRDRDAILAILHTETGIDFSRYKSTTVNRRIRRRMLLNHIKTLPEYRAFLEENPGEIEALRKDMFIHITSFFREIDQFEALEKSIFPRLVQNRSSKTPITVWAPGCATGEEAYSLAIAFQEFLGKKTPHRRIKIVATDIDEGAIRKARKGLYEKEAVSNVSPQRLRRFFIKENGGYQVKQEIRSMCEFLVHDVTHNPPIDNADLISCHNLLIYLGQELQQKALIRMRQALAPNGFLVLGKAEGLDNAPKLFHTIDSKLRIYSPDDKGIVFAREDLRDIPHLQGRERQFPSQKMQPEVLQQFSHQHKINNLKGALSLAQKYAAEIIDELDAMNVEQQSSNEELSASNEELLSANEELKTAQEEIQASNEDLRKLNEELILAKDYAEAIVNTLQESLIVLNSNLHVKSANKAFYDTFKVTPKETENTLLFDLGNKQWNIPQLRTLLKKTLPQKSTVDNFIVEHNFEIIGKKTMILNARTLQQRQEEKPLILLTIKDITELRKGERSLKESEERFRRLIESAKDYAIFMMDVKGNILSWNKGAENLLGYTEAEVIGKSAVQLFTPEDRKAGIFKRMLATVIKNGRSQNENWLMRKDGSRFWVTGVTTAIYNEAGKMVSMSKIARDVTERKKAEELLQAQKEIFQTLSDNATLSLFIIDEKHHCTFMNRAAEKMTGFTFEAVQKANKPLHDIIHHTRPGGSHYPMCECPIDMALPQKSRISGEDVFVRPDGSFYPVAFMASPILNKGKPVGTVIEARDTTEEKKAEEERRQLERHKDEFIGIASHELKTPVTSIKAYTQILQHRFQKAGDMKSAGMAEKMNAQIDKLTGLIGDLLDVTKVESGRLQFHEGTFDFNALVEEIVEEMQRTTDRHILTPHLAESQTIVGDRDRIGQVITNFLSNAIKYSPYADKIIIQTTTDKEWVTLCVRDFGYGISKENQKKVFDRFYRVEASGQETYSGLGLGLYIASEIIKRHNGKIWVESEEGKGSTFCFSLPLK